MRNSGIWLSIKTPLSKRRGEIPRGDVRAGLRLCSLALLVGLGLSHDFLRREVDAAGGEGIADKEVVGLARIEILAILEVRIFGNRQRKLDRLRHHLAL